MKKYVIILVLIGFWGCEEVENISIVGAWTVSKVCTFENEDCSG